MDQRSAPSLFHSSVPFSIVLFVAQFPWVGSFFPWRIGGSHSWGVSPIPLFLGLSTDDSYGLGRLLLLILFLNGHRAPKLSLEGAFFPPVVVAPLPR